VLGRHVRYYAFWTRIGWIGVELFFVLSGFLISGLLFQEFQRTGGIDYKKFVLRRGMKIWPSYYVLFTVAIVIVAFGNFAFHTWPDGFPYSRVLAHALFLQNYGYHTFFYLRPLEHTWSLAVEEHFYLLLPLFLISVIHLNRKRKDPFVAVAYVSVLFFFACLALRMTSPLPGSQPILAATHLRIDSLFAGVAIGYLFHFRRRWFQRIAEPHMLLFIPIFCSPAFFLESNSRWMQIYGLSCLVLGFVIVVAWSVEKDPSKLLGKKVASTFSRIGRDSYSIYLWHYPLALYFSFVRSSAIVFWFYLALAITLGMMMTKAVEQPFLRLRDRVLPSSKLVELERTPASSLAPAD
jgi:peptidoglycan/LPS O-acetylase OafA/YrhL